MSIFTLATDVYASTGLWLETHEVTSDEITVNLMAEPELLKQEPTAQESAVKAAYDRYLALHKIYDVDAKLPLHLRVVVDLSDTTIDYDGTRLVRED